MARSKTQAPVGRLQFFDGNGDPLSGGTLTVYLNGTTTLATIYSDAAGTVSANPVTLDARGECQVFLGTGDYKYVVADSSGSNIYTQDNIQAIEDFTFADGEGIVDENDNELLNFTVTASAVNNFDMSNAATGNSPVLSVEGGDTNIDMNFQIKGIGVYNLKSSATTSSEIRLFEDTDNGSNYIGLKAPAAITTTVSYILPEDGTSDKLLFTDGSGTLSWSTINGLTADASPDAAADYVLTYDASATAHKKVLLQDLPGLTEIVEDTTPQLGGQLDVNGNAIGDGTLELLAFTETASAVNHINITNAATGNGPIISAVGDDTNVSLNLDAKGTGNVTVTGNALVIDNGATGAGEIRLLEDSDNGTNYIAFKAPSAVTATKTFTLPDGDGTNGQALVTNGSGTLSWGSAGGSSVNAWVRFAPSSGNAVSDSLNVSSITDHGSGDFTINFTTALGNSNFAVAGTAANTGTNPPMTVNEPTTPSRSTSSVRINCLNNSGTGTDTATVSVIIVGDA